MTSAGQLFPWQLATLMLSTTAFSTTGLHMTSNRPFLAVFDVLQRVKMFDQRPTTSVLPIAMVTTALHWSYDVMWTNQTVIKHLKRSSFTQSESSCFVFVYIYVATPSISSSLLNWLGSLKYLPVVQVSFSLSLSLFPSALCFNLLFVISGE
jgi:hypothetical protein